MEEQLIDCQVRFTFLLSSKALLTEWVSAERIWVWFVKIPKDGNLVVLSFQTFSELSHSKTTFEFQWPHKAQHESLYAVVLWRGGYQRVSGSIAIFINSDYPWIHSLSVLLLLLFLSRVNCSVQNRMGGLNCPVIWHIFRIRTSGLGLGSDHVSLSDYPPH